MNKKTLIFLMLLAAYCVLFFILVYKVPTDDCENIVDSPVEKLFVKRYENCLIERGMG